jgi:hypothetical protein
MIVRAHEALNRGELLQEFIPCPKELLDTESQFNTNDAEKANLEKFGYGSWYDFNVANWGTKWDVGDASSEVMDANTLKASFDTAWAPPIEAYARLEELGFEVEAFYYEPGMAFVGKYADGDDDCYEYGGYTSSTVRDAIGEELDDYFGISENMAEWEEENEEDEENIDIDLDGGLSAVNEGHDED